MKICIYSCNFGKYRSEIKIGIDTIFFYDSIDYYFFTDDTNITSKKWKIINIPMIPGDNIMDSYRWTSKYIKFITPDIIKEYDIIIWCDSKCFIRPDRRITIDPNTIINFFSNTNYDIVNMKHFARNTPHEEIVETMRLNLENEQNVLKFSEKIKDITYNYPLPETCIILRRNNETTNNLMEHVYNLLKQYGLKRDQNVFNHAIYEVNYPIDKLYMIKNINDLQ